MCVYSCRVLWSYFSYLFVFYRYTLHLVNEQRQILTLRLENRSDKAKIGAVQINAEGRGEAAEADKKEEEES
jgi:hypothetical protein